jgi:hypothetical protein
MPELSNWAGLVLEEIMLTLHVLKAIDASNTVTDAYGGNLT